MIYSPSSYDAIRDGNRVPVAMGQDSTDATQTLPFLVDPITGRLLVDSTGTGSNAIYNEVVSGSGTSWTLAHTPTTGTLQLYANGQRLMETTDYTLSGTTITTLTSWATGTLLADYLY